jgi:ribosome maturation factor RimP
MLEQKVKDLLEEGLSNREDLYLISLTISAENAIRVIIDGDNGVAVEDCIYLSRAVEHNIDREEEDFSLEVMSSGASEPLINKRQYKKHIGRVLTVRVQDESFEGNLTEANDQAITLEWKAREPKPIGKGKVTVQKKKSIDYTNINEAKVVIKF